MKRHPPSSPRFPYPTLFRSVVAGRYVPALSVFNRLLGEAPEVEPQFVYYQRLLAKDDDEAEELFDDHVRRDGLVAACEDRKSTRLNSSHANISYAVFCLKKK